MDENSSDKSAIRGHKKVGWASDIVAPRQEVDTLSLIHEQAAIQKMLESPELTPANFVNEYREFLKEYRNVHRRHRADERSERQPARDSSGQSKTAAAEDVDPVQSIAQFGAQASMRARRQARARSVLLCNCSDRSGVLAALAEAIADEGGNIMGAFMSVVAGHLIAALVVSGPPIDREAIDREAIKRRVKDETKLRRDDVQIDVRRLEADEIDLRTPGSTCWHASARLRGDQSLLLGLTGAIADQNIPVVAISSWLEPDIQTGDAVQVVDLNFVIPAGTEGEDIRTIKEIEKNINDRLSMVHNLTIVPVTWPTRSWSHRHANRPEARAAVVTVVGTAQTNFVYNVVRMLIKDIEAVVEIQNSSMVLLEGTSVLTIMFTRSQKSRLRDLDKQIRRKLSVSTTPSEDRDSAVGQSCTPIAIQVVAARARSGADVNDVQRKRLPGKSKRKWPTHELSIIAVEQPRVVAKVAGLLADSKVNIFWFVSHVLDPVVGERWPMYAIQMHIYVPKKKRDAVGRSLHTLRETEGWQEVSMREWSLADGDNRR